MALNGQSRFNGLIWQFCLKRERERERATNERTLGIVILLSLRLLLGESVSSIKPKPNVPLDNRNWKVERCVTMYCVVLKKIYKNFISLLHNLSLARPASRFISFIKHPLHFVVVESGSASARREGKMDVRCRRRGVNRLIRPRRVPCRCRVSLPPG